MYARKKWVRLALCAALLGTGLRGRGGDPSPAAGEAPARPPTIAWEALRRLQGIDLDANPAVKAALLKVLAQAQGTPQFVEIVDAFHLPGQHPALLDFALSHPNTGAGVRAMRLLLRDGDLTGVRAALTGPRARAAVEALGHTADQRVVPMLAPLVSDSGRDLATRQAVVRALVQVQEGAAALLALARQGHLSPDLRLTASTELNMVRWPALKAEAAQVLPLPQARNAQPLPPLALLAQMPGDATRGAAVFHRATVGCSNCHQVRGQGIDFGPNLSEIGTKLGKEALLEAILDPSAGIAFGYEAWQIELREGDEVYGLIASETPDELAMKTVGGIVTRYQKRDIVKRERQKLSIMPTGLQQAMTTQDLVDLVTYLASLKKAPSSASGGAPAAPGNPPAP